MKFWVSAHLPHLTKGNTILQQFAFSGWDLWSWDVCTVPGYSVWLHHSEDKLGRIFPSMGVKFSGQGRKRWNATQRYMKENDSFHLTKNCGGWTIILSTENYFRNFRNLVWRECYTRRKYITYQPSFESSHFHNRCWGLARNDFDGVRFLKLFTVSQVLHHVG